MNKSKRVWAIYYTIRVNSDTPWSENWVGPCGIHIIPTMDFSSFGVACLSDRPFFFRTRALARQRAKELSELKNITWKWVKYQVRPLLLTWEPV